MSKRLAECTFNRPSDSTKKRLFLIRFTHLLSVGIHIKYENSLLIYIVLFNVPTLPGSTIYFTRASKHNPVLLFLDGHTNNAKNMVILDLVRYHGVHVLSFPLHALIGSIPYTRISWNPSLLITRKATKSWLRANSGRVEWLPKFRGTWPLNRDIFTKTYFLAAATRDINLAESGSIPNS